MSRFAILAQSALTGLVMGLVFGGIALGVLAIAAAVVPMPERLVDRGRIPAIVVCLVVVPVVLAVLGWLEGLGKVS